jgi:uncharacterized FlaG/YvyC family protein
MNTLGKIDSTINTDLKKENSPVNKEKDVDTDFKVPEVKVSEHQYLVRNMSFKLNEEKNEMYVEIRDGNDEVVRTIPADENDPKFIELIKNNKPGMIIDHKG